MNNKEIAKKLFDISVELRELSYAFEYKEDDKK